MYMIVSACADNVLGMVSFHKNQFVFTFLEMQGKLLLKEMFECFTRVGYNALLQCKGKHYSRKVPNGEELAGIVMRGKHIFQNEVVSISVSLAPDYQLIVSQLDLCSRFS